MSVGDGSHEVWKLRSWYRFTIVIIQSRNGGKYQLRSLLNVQTLEVLKWKV